MEESIMVVLGRLVGAAEKTRPRAEKQRAARIMARARITGCERLTPRARPMIRGTRDMRIP